MLRLIESFNEWETTRIDRMTYPAECVLEGDDGIRVGLVTTLREMRGHLWFRLHSSGVRYLVAPEGGGWAAIKTDRFLQLRDERHDALLLNSGWKVYPFFPSFFDLEDESPALVTEFVHLHSHSEHSALDGLSRVEEMVEAVVADDQPALALTDHGSCAGHPVLSREAKKHGIKPIYGIEAFFVNDRFVRENQYDYYHLILWAKDDIGLRNLWAMNTEAYREGFYGRPRMDWDTLARHSEGVMAATGCLRGPVSRMLLADDEDGARMTLGRLLGIFGEDLYVELQTNALPEQRMLNERLVGMAHDLGVPLLLTSDSHYPTKDDRDTHKVWIASQTRKDLQDDTGLFVGESHYHLMTAVEAAESVSYLPPSVVAEAMKNTVVVADKAGATIGGKAKPPVFSKGDPKVAMDKDVDRLLRLCLSNWDRIMGKTNPPEVYEARFEKEMRLLISKGYTGYFLMVSDYCLDPSTPVLTEDLRWVEVGKLEVGDRLVGFDEGVVIRDGNRKGHRYWHGSEVVQTRRVVLPTYRVTLEDGTQTVVSEDHQWLVSKGQGHNQWVKTKDLMEFGLDPRYNDPKKIPVRAQRLVREWDEPDTWEAGYIAGILDGEGYLTLSKMNNGGRSFSIGFSQREGAVLSTALGILDAWGFDYSVKDNGKGVKNVSIRGGQSEFLRLLGMARPKRLLEKLDVEMLGRVKAIDKPIIVSVEPLGLGEVVALETTTGTLVAQGFAHHNCRWARNRGILVGPGRGSGAGSLVAYLAEITGIDPVEADLMFERFLTEGRNALPDFDVDFPTSKRSEITDYIIGRYGEENVVRVGTHIRLKNKGVVRDLARVLKSTIEIHPPDIEAISKIIENAEADRAGLGMTWEELWEEFEEDLSPYARKYPELFGYAEKIVGRLKTYGKHAAGVVISPDARLTENLPLRTAGDEIVAEFDMESLESLGLVKFDLLTLSTLDKIQMCVDLIREQTGEVIDIAKWDEEYRDPMVWEQIGMGNTLGIFQIETPGSTRDTEELKPQNLDELSDVITLVRPGPKRSGLTDLYVKRKRGEEPITYLDSRLEPILNKTFGCMIYQEQVIRTCMVLAGYNETEADDVRKILGKKKIELVEEAGKTFIERAIANKTSPEVAETIWAQMAEFARYSFNRSHAYSYAMLGYWTAWLKFNYPLQFLTAALSTVEKGRIPEFISEANRMGYRVLPPDINLSGSGFRVVDNTIRYGFDGVKGIGAAAVDAIVQNQPYSSFEDFMERKGGKANLGVVKLLVAVGAFDSLGEDRRLLEAKMEWKEGVGDKCAFWNPNRIGPNGLPCEFDWENEPLQIGSRGQPLKPKPIPKRCTKACRNFTPRTFEPGNLPPMTEKEIQQREVELLGIYLSSTPFDAIPPKMWEEEVAPGINMVRGSEVKRADRGRFVVAALVSRVRPIIAKNGAEMAFVGFNAVDAELDCVVFSDEWKQYRRYLRQGKLGLAYVRKTDRGLNLLAYHPI